MSQSGSVCGKMPRFASAWCVWSVVHFVILLALTKDCAEAQQIRGPASDFSRHTLAMATVHHGRTKREISHTKDTNGLHHTELTATVEADGQPYVLDLTLTRHLIPAGHSIHYQQAGERRSRIPTKEELNLCQYSGVVRDRPGSWAAVSTCHGLRGVFYDGQMLRYIEPSGGDFSSPHFLYDHTDLSEAKPCGARGGVTTNASYDPELFDRYHRERNALKANRYKRSPDDAHQVRGPSGANKQSRYVELVLVSDHAEFLAAGGSVDAVHHQLKDLANILNALYAPLNVFVALVGVVVWSERDEIQLLENGDDTLTNFLHYRKLTIIPTIPNDNAQLVTRKVFKDGVVGKALKGPMCTYTLSGGVNRNHSTVMGLVAATIAHEMGHNFGLEHDDDNVCSCPEDKCIMYPSSTSYMPVHWSSCSMRSLALAFDRGIDYCLRNKPKSLFDSPTCGNGFVEAGEQCDCGTPLDLHHSACTACCRDDCTLRGNATCATGACCDMTKCRPMAAGAECRGAERECDLPEYCSGHSEYCPADVFKMDATPCGHKLETYCVRGSCRSRGDQCRLLWGATGEMSHPTCYTTVNVRGNWEGNCGYDRVTQTYARCRPEDALCGMLQCRHLNEQLEFGMENVSSQSQTFLTDNGTIVACRAALVDLGLDQVDPGLVPDGARCGTDKMCMSQRCVPVATVLQTVRAKETSVCPSNCSGHGVCNSEGHCHCEPGFAPPLCALPGPGGSYDSGPSTDPSVQRNFMVAMYVIFLGIIPAILLVLFLIYYSRHNVLRWGQKPKKSIQSPKKSSLQRRISRSASKFAANFQSSNSNGTAPPVNVHTLSSPDDMSSSLLRSDSDRSPSGNINPSVNFFGNFKGFSLTPVEKNQTTQDDVAIISTKAEPKAVGKIEAINVNKSAKITPVHRTGSNVQTLVNQGVLKPVLRSAPPLPVVPASVKSGSPKTSPSIKRANSSVQNKIKALMNADKNEDLNPASNNPPPRPVISSPILEASTCTAKELISPLQGSKTLGPIRAAPSIPGESPDLPKRPLSMHGSVLQKPLPEEPKKVKEGISLNRIASFLKQDKPKEKERKPVERSHSLPKNPNHLVKVPKAMDKVALRNLQISSPILQKEIELPSGTVPVVSDSEDCEDPRAFVNRTQSMRAPVATPKPLIQSFGSMRQAPGVPRPVSVVGRPTAPPPPLPNQPSKDKSYSSSIYQNPKPLTEIRQTDYVDCIEEKQAPLAHIDEESCDNIYAIIEESPEKHSKPLPGVPPPIKTIPQAPPEGYNTPKPTKPVGPNSGSSESMGLLGEIVDEIQNRNFDSIYSASTLKRKKEKQKANAEGNRDSTYMNTEYKTPESVYSNSGAKSTVSTTSSGYLHPSAVNVPTFMNKESHDMKQAEGEKTPPSPTMKVNSKIPTFSRQVTPPVLKNTSTFRNVPSSPKNLPKNVNAKPITANSPDVVSSCAVPEIKSAKPPDVINNNKLQFEAPKVTTKPSVTPKVNDNFRPPIKLPTNDKKVTAVKPTPVLKPVNSSSNLKSQESKNPALKNVSSKVDSNVKAIADNLNKNKPKIVPKPASINAQKNESATKPSGTKLAARPSNVASLQQKFENRKSFGRDSTTVKK